MQEFESCEIYIAILLLGFAANDLKKSTIRDGGSTALYTAYTVLTCISSVKQFIHLNCFTLLMYTHAYKHC